MPVPVQWLDLMAVLAEDVIGTGMALECLTCLRLMPASTEPCSGTARVFPSLLSPLCSFVRAFMRLLIKVGCKMPLPDNLVKSVSSTKLCSLFTVQCESVMIVFHMGKLNRGSLLGEKEKE